METARMELDRMEAHRLYRKYQEHKHHSRPMDHEIERIYKLISQGKVIVRALASIKQAGLGPDHLPKLAISRADMSWCYMRVAHGGECRMADEPEVWRPKAASKMTVFQRGDFPGIKQGSYKAMVPHIPPDIRPKRGLQNYHVLFEADWTEEPPIDPLLLRRMGKGDMWLVVGAWNLTEVERGVMADRIGRQQ